MLSQVHKKISDRTNTYSYYVCLIKILHALAHVIVFHKFVVKAEYHL